MEEFISEVRIGMTYAARVLVAIDTHGEDITTSMPVELCLKFTKLPFYRSLARESWFYEQLREGILTAQCYGFFTIDLPSGDPNCQTVVTIYHPF
jgi:hypothetical protein